MEKEKIKIVTHSGEFHVDDVCATATLLLLLEGKDVEIIRTRDIETIKNGDFVFDVGGIYDPNKNRFDHHQSGGAGERENEIPYSSFGLIWKKYGAELCGSQEAADNLDRRFVQPVDALDNGIDIHRNIYPELHPYLFFNVVLAFRPTWKESHEKLYQSFLDIVEFTKEILKREIKHSQDNIEGKNKVTEIYNSTEDKQIIILDDDYPWESVLSKHPEPLYIIRPNLDDKTWWVKAVRDDVHSFKNRKDLPESWAGLTDEELQKVTGVDDAIFCHNKRFLVVAKSKEGAIKLAKLALDN